MPAIMLCVFILVAVTVICIAVSPLVIAASFSYANSCSRQSGQITGHWIHPAVLSITYDVAKRAFKTRLFGKIRSHPEKTDFQNTTRQDINTGFIKKNAQKTALSRVPEKQAIKTEGTQPFTEPEPQKLTADYKKKSFSKTPENYSSGTEKTVWQKIKITLSLLKRQHLAKKILRWGARLLRLCFKIIRFDRFSFIVKAGFDDPAELGKVYGWYTGLRSIIRQRKNVTVQFEPCFSASVLEFDFDMAVRSSLMRLLAPVAAALVTFPYLSAFVFWRRLKKGYGSTSSR
jgi:hypothetical protein